MYLPEICMDSLIVESTAWGPSLGLCTLYESVYRIRRKEVKELTPLCVSLWRLYRYHFTTMSEIDIEQVNEYREMRSDIVACL